jgi:hypothetical protein
MCFRDFRSSAGEMNSQSCLLSPARESGAFRNGLTADPATVEQHFRMLGSVLPSQAYNMVIEQIRRISAASSGTLAGSLGVRD